MLQPTPFDPADRSNPSFLKAFLEFRDDTSDEIVQQFHTLSIDELAARMEADALTARLRSFDQYRTTLPDPAHGPISIGQLKEPLPRLWTVSGVVPAGVPTILAGHSGIGKSYFALLLAICVVAGRSFLGRDVKPGNVLWIDRELDKDEMTRRSYAVARGLGMDSPPDGLHYVRPTYPIGTDGAQTLIMEAIQQSGATLCVLDSLTLGAVGDAKEQKDMVGVMRHVEAWGTSLSIDHITKSAAAGNHSSATIYGSAMKRAMARSTFLLTPAGEGLALRPDKSNFGPATSSLYLVVQHGSDESERAEVVFRVVEGGDPSLAGAEDHAPAHEQTLFALQRLHTQTGQPVSLSALASEREVKATTVRNHISKLGGALVKHGDSTYSPAPSLEIHGDEGDSEPASEDGGSSATYLASRVEWDDSPFTAPKGAGASESPESDPWTIEDPT